ncbi:MAG: DNA double-strand break repair nuclease NurA [Methermicoccaceae archaeon]
MLYLDDLLTELNKRKEELMLADNTAYEELENFKKRLADAGSVNGSILPEHAGARPVEDGNLIRPFEAYWETREDALSWVDSVISNLSTGAVDGSQIYPQHSTGPAISYVQALYIINHHASSDVDERIEEKTFVRLLTPSDFEDARVYAYSKEFVDAVRFVEECACMGEVLKKGAFGLFDGSLIVSHANALNANIRARYLHAVTTLLSIAESSPGVLAAYIDAPHSRDVVRMMSCAFEELSARWLTDALLLRDSMMGWGDRTKVFVCDRDDRRYGEEGRETTLESYGEWKDKIAFFYIRLNKSGVSRVEFPLEVYEQGLTEKLADVIRAESLIRGDYPDILWRAHSRVIIHMKERKLFNECVGSIKGETNIDWGAKDFYKQYEASP